MKSTPRSVLLLALGATLAFLVIAVPVGFGIASGFFDPLIASIFGGEARARLLPPASMTLPPAWTATPMPTGTLEMAVGLPGQVAYATAPYTDTPDPNEDIDLLTRQADSYLDRGNYGQALLLWDRIIARDPENHYAYYRRASTYLELIGNQRSQEEFEEYNYRVIADMDQAIALAPEPIGDYFYARFCAYDNLSGLVEYRADFEILAEVALENMELAFQFTHSRPFATRGYIFMLLGLGRYDEALEEAQRQILERGENVAPNSRLHYALASVYLQRGEYWQALNNIDLALSICTDCYSYRKRRVEILYHLGRVTEALEELDRIIEENPYYGGERYYLRALIHQEMGNTEQARDDLYFGAGNTWEHGGLYPYVQSLLASTEGNDEAAVELLRYAEATMRRYMGPFLERFQQELADQLIPPLEVTPSIELAVTPIPTPGPEFPRANPRLIMKYSESTGPVILEPGETLDINFVPPLGYDPAWINAFRLFLLPYQAGSVEEVEVFVWSDDSAKLESIDAEWGENLLLPSRKYVSVSGEIFFRFHNPGEQQVEFDDIGMAIDIETQDGSPMGWGFAGPYPTPTPTRTPRPTPGVIVIPEGAIPADPEAGTGPLTIQPDEELLFHFVFGPGTPNSIGSLDELTLYMFPATPSEGNIDVEFRIWNYIHDRWGYIHPIWGENPVAPTVPLMSHKGDMVVSIRPIMDHTVEIENIQFRAVITDPDGNRVTYGYDPD